ncbi:MAG: ATP-binding protein, partial [archaeon]|nr:ATP-binding protein [archaeon]
KPKELIAIGQCSIINLRGLDLSVQRDLIDSILGKIYEASTKKQIPPCFIFMDEAHELAGKKSSSVMEKVRLIAQEGRKFGLNLAIITQRPQLLDVTLRAQAGTWIIHKLTDINDVNISCKSAEGLSKENDEEIQMLGTGEAIVTGDITPLTPLHVKIRKRYTVHGGAGYNILDFVKKNDSLYKSELIDQLKTRITPKELESAQNLVIIDNKQNKLSPKMIDEMQEKIRILTEKNKQLSSENTERNKQIKNLKIQFEKEKKRAEDAVSVAEKTLDALKKKS